MVMAPKRCASVAELPRCREENCEGGPHETGPALGVRPRLGGSLCGRPENGRALGRNSTISRIGFTAASVLRSVPTCRCVPRSLFSRKRAAWCLLLTNSGIWCTTSSPYCSIQAREQGWPFRLTLKQYIGLFSPLFTHMGDEKRNASAS